MANKLIIPRITGGLGNQLFIYAAARRMALVNGAELALDDKSGFVRDFDYRRSYQLDHFSIPCRKATPEERLEPFSRLQRYVRRHWNQHLPFAERTYLVQEGIDFDSRLLTFQPHGEVYLEGYWQSELYFKDVELQIREDLSFKSPIDATNQSIAAQICSTNAIAVHVRFFDLIWSNQIDNSMINKSREYYKRAIHRMEEYLIDAHYYIFSDQPQRARELIPLPDNRLTIISNNRDDSVAYCDLWLIHQCNHFIIANSTFSWWGAWLAKNKEKIVIAPKIKNKTPNPWGFSGLLPKSWILC